MFRVGLLTIVAFCVLVPVAVSGTTYASAVSAPTSTISRGAAIDAALRQFPETAGVQVLKTELEPRSTHFQFADVNGGSFGEDDVRECLIVPPLPLQLACRSYPVWVIEVAGPGCDATIAINAYSGRFGGAGTNGCNIRPEDRPILWFVATWE